MMTPHDEGRALDAAWEAVDGGDPEGALVALEPLSARGDAPPEAALIACLAWLDLGEPLRAQALLAVAAPGIEEDDLDLRWATASVDLALWRVAEAREGFESIASEEPSPAALMRLALAEDLLGNPEAADRAMERAAAVDSDLALTPRLSGDDFESVVQRAARELPPPFHDRLDEIAVVIDPVPSLELGRSQPADTPPDALGLFVGPSDLDRHPELSGVPSPTIYLYQRNIERACRSVEELEAEIRITLLHEFGHALGFDEDGVDALGLG
ncbi:metallopeptidase family protein [Engelhardtia mirabilis]|uniref:Possibl zinc metallo-peptidase n=1 Tax=Engelhardtia mirabilis TaxID=2528011 RepID=A0A518BQ85_9BACT|nr:Possibl zinc metallo-peptidase [Planctomycetes bacterium Pla133]QDV03460.1 Possibl zinc metallo-peptidase [Planctomycetes bacterium Pla86]